MYLPLTLDEYCNPSLESNILETRNENQVVLRHQKKKKGSAQHRAITVPQAWLWTLGNYIISALPSDTNQDNLLLRNMVESRRWIGSSWCRRPFDTNQLLGTFLSDLVDILHRPAMAGLSEPIFNIFEKTIVDLSKEIN
jgi:hypothetical protein